MNVNDTISILTTLHTITANTTQAPPFIDRCSLTPTAAANVIYATFFIGVIVVSVVGNAFVCFAILTCNRLRSRKPNYFIISLAVSDMMFSLTVTTYLASYYANNAAFCHSLAVCKAYVVMDGMSTTASITCLFLIALDRYLAVGLPYQYPQLVNSRRMGLALGLLWLYACLWGGLSTFNWQDPTTSGITIEPQRATCQNTNFRFYATSLSVVYLIPLFVMALLYLRILSIAYGHARAIRATAVQVQDYDLPLSGGDESSSSSKRKTKSKQRRELKATKTLAIVYGAFVVCWLPLWIVNIILFLKPEVLTNLTQTNPVAIRIIYHAFIEILPTLSTAINPFIYSLSSKYFRDGFKQMFRKVAGRYFKQTSATKRNGRSVVADRETSDIELEPHS